MHLPAISQRDRPATAATATNTSSSDYSTSSSTDSTSPLSASEPSNPRFILNPLKFVKAERKDGKDEQELDLWYMTQPGDYRYWMYLQDGTAIRLMQQRLQQTFNRRGRRPHTPIEAPSAGFPQPTSESVRARLNLLKWLSSSNCLLFYECEEVVEVDDLELDTILNTAQSTTDGGAKAIQILMRWSKEGRRYTVWQEVQSDMVFHMADPVAANEGGKEKEALRRLVEEEKRRKDKLSQRMERERQERFTALKKRQEEERGIRQQRKQEKDQHREKVAQRRETSKLAVLSASKRTSTANPSSVVSLVENGRGGRRTKKLDKMGEKKAGSEDGDRGAEADEQTGEADDHDDVAEQESTETVEVAKDVEGVSPQSSSNANSAHLTPAKEAQEEKQPTANPAIDTLPSDSEDESSAQPVVSAVSTSRPSSRAPAILTPLPSAAGHEVMADRLSARGKSSARRENGGSRPGTARSKASEEPIATTV